MKNLTTLKLIFLLIVLSVFLSACNTDIIWWDTTKDYSGLTVWTGENTVCNSSGKCTYTACEYNQTGVLVCTETEMELPK